ncbi:alpha-amylase family protein [Magnetospirillum sp. UT-4]|uniref:alpha-amylase family protein n=1 Tax=Magnetospirillum sp. UT-4 TaxID=2681467 RepID=UPI00137CD142|nr:alpha-amylase family protein [Magnetospirillum sp. UT-4]CAA7616901.1 Glycosidase [Magnetospirillum sp. UT-4]
MWYKNAVVYSLDVETFMDADGDGTGDFRGLIDRIDHFETLGVTCIWLQPFFPSPNRDDGYDITDYYGVDPRLGNLGDFAEFAHQLGQRGIRLILDLVVNHTSDRHPWFLQACADAGSPYRDYYVWSRDEPAGADTGMVFPGQQERTWTWNEQAGAWYFHRFYAQQPDLNIANPAVRDEILRIMGFWLRLGISGFRVDAAPFLIELAGAPAEQGRALYSFLADMRQFVSWRAADAVLLAEANVAADSIEQYFGAGHRMNVLFNFLVNQALFLALARREAAPLAAALDGLPGPGPTGAWANFLRTHDELDLGRLAAEEREQVFAAFGPDPDMQIYGRGIRRRLATMMDGDPGRQAMAFSLMFTLPGLQVIRYGDEIGMGDDLSLEAREAVRTPMQWSDAANGGFSRAPADGLIRPVIASGRYGCSRVNVRGQLHDPDSLLNIVSRLIRMRRSCPEIGLGECRVVTADRPGIFALRFHWRDRDLLAVHNLAAEACEAELDMDPFGDGQAVELIGAPPSRPLAGRTVPLGPYGYRWFRVETG